MYVQDTLFVPNLRHNLISIGQLNSNNYKNVFEGKYCNSFYKNILVVEVTMIENRMFLLRMESNVVCLKNLVDDSWIWHKRFGHLNFGSLSLMQKKNLVRGFHSSIESIIRYLKVVPQGNNKEQVFLIISLDHMSHWIQYIQIFVALCKPCHLETISVFYYLQTIIQEFIGFISEVIILNILIVFKSLKFGLRRNRDII